MIPRENKENDGIASQAAISELFRSRMSKIAYAWNVVRALGDVEARFLKQGNVTVNQVGEIADNLSRILNDSSRVNEAWVLINVYLTSGDLEGFLRDSKKLSDIVSKNAEKIDFTLPAEKAAELFTAGVKDIDLPPRRISIEKNLRSDGEHGPAAQVIESDVSLKSLLLGIWKQETSKLSHDFRVIETNSPAILALACEDYHQRLKKMCAFLKDIFSLRDGYKASLKGFFGGQSEMSDKKKIILNRIERKLAELVDQKNTLDAAEIYTELRPVLEEALAGIKKPGRLKKLISTVIEKNDSVLLPAPRKASSPKLG
jgi:hypothetical protein